MNRVFLFVAAVLATASLSLGQATRPSTTVIEDPSVLKVRIADLESQIQTLQKENAFLRKQLAAAKSGKPLDATTTKPSPSDRPPEIAAAIKDGRLIKGMTIDDCKAAVRGDWQLERDQDGSLSYVCVWIWISPDPRNSRTERAEVARATIENGIVVRCETNPQLIKLWEEFNMAPPKANGSKKP